MHSSIEQEKLSARFVATLEELAKKEAMYRVRISVGSNSFVFASVPACQLLGSAFKDDITVHMNAAKVVGLSYHVASSNCVKTSPIEKPEFHTSVQVKLAEEGPRPNLDPLNTGKATATTSSPTAPTEPEPEPNFIQKYVRLSFRSRFSANMMLTDEFKFDSGTICSPSRLCSSSLASVVVKKKSLLLKSNLNMI